MTRISTPRPSFPPTDVVFHGGPRDESTGTVKTEADALPPSRLTFVQYEVTRGKRADLAFHTYLRGDAGPAQLGEPWPYEYLDPFPADPEEPADV